jgi:two-component system sensor histidine kinase HupT/HoxJ
MPGEKIAQSAAELQQEEAWIEVIRKMDETYADLVRYQVELERKNAQLEDTQNFVNSVLSAMTDVLIVCDLQGRIQQVNRALEDLTGLREAELRGMPVKRLIASGCPIDPAEFAALSCHDALQDCEITLKGRTGDMPLAVNCTARHDRRGRPLGLVLVGRPVGELRKAYQALNAAHAELQQTQQQLVGAEKMASLGRLVAGVAHELNNPISFVYGNVHALQRYGERLAEYFAAVSTAPSSTALRQLREQLRIDHILKDLPPLMAGTLEGAERVRDIVQDLRRFSSGQQGERAAFDLAHVIETAVLWVTKGARRDLVTDLDTPGRLMCRGHAGQVHQVVMNLVQNAIDATDSQAAPCVTIRAGRDGETVWFTVADNGPGIPDEQLLKVFDPFFTTKPVGQGTGLGLSISYGIVTEHGGRITAINRPEGGAEFRVELPAEA